MEVYAGFGEYCDHEIGRLFDAIGETGQLDNTLIFYILGDNGTSAEGGMSGMFSEMTYFNGVQETVQDMLKHYDDWGGPDDLSAHGRGLGRRGRHAVHVDQADSLQLRRHPQWHDRLVAQAHQGRQPDALAVAPRHRRGSHRARSREPARTQERQRHRPGADRRREHGLHASTTPTATSTHKTQYFEIFGNRAIYHDGWFAGTIHRAPWEKKPRAQAAGGHLGTLRHAQRLQPGQRPGRGQSGEAQGAAGPLHEGGDQVSRAAHRRPRRSNASTRRPRAGPT